MWKYFACIIFSAIIFVFLTFLAYKSCVLLRLKTCRKGCNNLQTYTLSIIVFASLSAIPLILLVDIVNRLPKISIVTSGFVLTLSSALIGWLIQYVYTKLIEPLQLYSLEEEIKWTYILLCFGLALLCFTQNLSLYGYIFSASAFGKLCWLDINKENFLKEIDSFKKLPATYFYSLAFIIYCIIVAITFSKDTKLFYCSFLGLIIGVATVITYIALSKHNDK